MAIEYGGVTLKAALVQKERRMKVKTSKQVESLAKQIEPAYTGRSGSSVSRR